MPVIVKETNGNQQEDYFSPAALSMIMHIGKMNGWTHSGKDSSVFSKEVSEDLCDTLIWAACEMQKSLSSIEDHAEDLCNHCYLTELVKRNQIELIGEFAWFCDGKPFRINFEN
jgi:hypothetical protein